MVDSVTLVGVQSGTVRQMQPGKIIENSMRTGLDPAQPDWAAVRDAYLARDLTVSEICNLFSIASAKLYQRGHAEGWPKRRPARDTANEEADRTVPHPQPDRIGRIVNRLFDALELQMDDIDHRLNGPAESDPASRERDARTLASLVRTLEKLCALQAPSAGRSAAARKLEPEDVDQMRNAVSSPRPMPRMGAQHVAGRPDWQVPVLRGLMAENRWNPPVFIAYSRHRAYLAGGDENRG